MGYWLTACIVKNGAGFGQARSSAPMPGRRLGVLTPRKYAALALTDIVPPIPRHCRPSTSPSR
eukprot:12420983-Karenia_brevis.AAC.1